MKDIFKLIEEYIPESYSIELYKNDKQKDIIHYNLFNEKKADIGYLKLTHSGKLKAYVYTGNAYKAVKHPLDEKSIIEKANAFLKTFYKDVILTLSSISTISNRYQIIYEEKEIKYNLYLPETGVKIILNLAGEILEVDKKIDKYKIAYPDRIISSEEAKVYYLKNLNLDLKICKLEKHGHYQLFYRINKKLINIPASGEDGEILSTKQQLESLEQFETSSKNLFRILGLNENYAKIAKKNKINFRIELWSKHSKKRLKQLNYNVNEPQQGVIKYKIDKHMNQIVQICDGDIFDEYNNQKITNKKAFDRALDFLFTIYPNAEELFDVLVSMTESENQIDHKCEPNYTFYFNRVHDSIEIENQIAYVGVGQYTGMINKFCSPTVTEKELIHINVFAKVSEVEAKALYAKELEVKLTFIKKIDEQEKIIYEPIYLPVFSKGKSSISLIDAHHGTLYDA